MMKNIWIFICGAGLLACSSVNTLTAEGKNEAVTEKYETENAVDSIVEPYREKLKDEMNEVIGRAEVDFTRGRPNGNLNNWATDALLVNQTRNVRLSSPVMAILNFGGLRNPLNKGDITIADVFKLMPFDNEIFWVEMPMSSLKDIGDYLIKRGGEPIAGATLKNGELTLNSVNENAETFIVITTDYLKGGGDNMTFFKESISTNSTGDILRNIFISEIKTQGTLILNDESRINLK